MDTLTSQLIAKAVSVAFGIWLTAFIHKKWRKAHDEGH